MQPVSAYKLNNKLYKAKPESTLQIAVIVPVKNEEDGLIRTLDALRRQVDEHGKSLHSSIYEVLLLANNCNDNTYLFAESYQAKYPEFNLHIAQIDIPEPDAHIGTVRRLMMDEAYERFISIGHLFGIIVSTDGDSEVDSQWIHYILMEMAKGNDVVGGRILPRDTPALSKIHHLRDVSYRYHVSRLESILDPCHSDPWPRHFQCYGPSLAVTCDIYHKAGRIPAIPYLEDEEFRKALYRIDAKVRKSPLVKVYTSARLIGKVDFGFSVQLQQWGLMTLENQQQQVEPLISLIKKTTLKNTLRQLWNIKSELLIDDSRLEASSAELMLDLQWLYVNIENCGYFGELWELIEEQLAKGNWRKLNALEPITQVISHFRQYFSAISLAS
ncbi:glycosyltransferase [Mucilaginibacter sp. JRF]|uniref:glycosyltransferase n=1 Tax=Mucilaginibacter sp. JRF TaxID=2780088 RepID=UPI00187FF474|nr:glycosyltransferase [Mucilaginibacter sp. JRF]MBE9584230.1 glycosyltransferase [Mucilaginibacter sp. JRF]